MGHFKVVAKAGMVAALCAGVAPAGAAEVSGKLLATGGVSQVEGAGGGGLTPWAQITGYGTRDQIGGNLHITVVQTQDFQLNAAGVAVGIFDRLELSAAKQEFKGALTPHAPLRLKLKLKQNIIGTKLRIAGDAVYAQDQWLPQIALGVQIKNNQRVRGLEPLGITQATRQAPARAYKHHAGLLIFYCLRAAHPNLLNALQQNSGYTYVYRKYLI